MRYEQVVTSLMKPMRSTDWGRQRYYSKLLALHNLILLVHFTCTSILRDRPVRSHVVPSSSLCTKYRVSPLKANSVEWGIDCLATAPSSISVLSPTPSF